MGDTRSLSMRDNSSRLIPAFWARWFCFIPRSSRMFLMWRPIPNKRSLLAGGLIVRYLTLPRPTRGNLHAALFQVDRQDAVIPLLYLIASRNAVVYPIVVHER